MKKIIAVLLSFTLVGCQPIERIREVPADKLPAEVKAEKPADNVTYQTITNNNTTHLFSDKQFFVGLGSLILVFACWYYLQFRELAVKELEQETNELDTAHEIVRTSFENEKETSDVRTTVISERSQMHVFAKEHLKGAKKEMKEAQKAKAEEEKARVKEVI